AGSSAAHGGDRSRQPNPVAVASHETRTAARSWCGCGCRYSYPSQLGAVGTGGCPPPQPCRRTLQESSKPSATADVALLRSSTEFASVHVLDHALAQRAVGIGTHS